MKLEMLSIQCLQGANESRLDINLLRSPSGGHTVCLVIEMDGCGISY